MSANRHLGRIIALQTLYEQDFRIACGDVKFNLEDVLERNINRYKDTIGDVDFVKRTVRGIAKDVMALDAELQPLAPEWPLPQIARMDRVVLRIGLWELKQQGETPPKVVINEAVELAKAFGGDNSSKFINGVLGTALRSIEGNQLKTPRKKPKETSNETTK